MFFLAEKLGKSIDEIVAMPHAQFLGWQVYVGRKAQSEQLATGGSNGNN